MTESIIAAPFTGGYNRHRHRHRHRQRPLDVETPELPGDEWTEAEAFQ